MTDLRRASEPAEFPSQAEIDQHDAIGPPKPH